MNEINLLPQVQLLLKKRVSPNKYFLLYYASKGAGATLFFFS